MNNLKYKLTLAMDRAGNKVVLVKITGLREFKIQTNGELPISHKAKSISVDVIREVSMWIYEHGTPAQKKALLKVMPMVNSLLSNSGPTLLLRSAQVLESITRVACTPGPHGTMMYFISDEIMTAARKVVAEAIREGLL